MKGSRSRRPPWFYLAATIVVGIGWYLAIVLSPGGRELMTGKHMLLATHSPLIPFLCFPVTSLLVGLAAWPMFRWFSRLAAVWWALGAALIGSILYVWLWSLVTLTIDVVQAGSWDPLADYSDPRFLAALTVLGPFAALQHGLLTVPTAIASGLVLHWAAGGPAREVGVMPARRPLAR
jgi:hypothetical protein